MIAGVVSLATRSKFTVCNCRGVPGGFWLGVMSSGVELSWGENGSSSVRDDDGICLFLSFQYVNSGEFNYRLLPSFNLASHHQIIICLAKRAEKILQVSYSCNCTIQGNTIQGQAHTVDCWTHLPSINISLAVIFVYLFDRIGISCSTWAQ